MSVLNLDAVEARCLVRLKKFQRFLIEKYRFADSSRDYDKNYRVGCVETVGPRIAPMSADASQFAWGTNLAASTCFQRVDYVGEELDGVCASADGSLELYVDNAPQYLTLHNVDTNARARRLKEDHFAGNLMLCCQSSHLFSEQAKGHHRHILATIRAT